MTHSNFVWQLDSIRDFLDMPNDPTMNRERAIGMRMVAQQWLMHLLKNASSAQTLWMRENHPELFNRYHPRG
jgi:hypothetical protein